MLGICNGFQVLTEAGLLPGALMRNAGLKFVCKPVTLSVEETQSAFTRKYEKGQSVTFPVAHGEGNYYADGDTLDVMVLCDVPSFVGCLMTGKLIGTISAEQTEKGKTTASPPCAQPLSSDAVLPVGRPTQMLVAVPIQAVFPVQ